MKGTDKNYQVVARTRTCDVLHTTRPVSTPFNWLSQDSLLLEWVRGYARRLVWFELSPFFGTPLYYFVLGGQIYLHFRSLWVKRRLATPNIVIESDTWTTVTMIPPVPSELSVPTTRPSPQVQYVPRFDLASVMRITWLCQLGSWT